MIELLRRFGGKFRRYMVIGPACKLIEVIFDLLTPLVIAQMIDKASARTTRTPLSTTAWYLAPWL